MGLLSLPYNLTASASDDTGQTRWTEGEAGKRGDVVFAIEVTGTITLTFQCSLDGTFTDDILAYPTDSVTGAATTAVSGIYWCDASAVKVRVKRTAGTGSALVRVGTCGS